MKKNMEGSEFPDLDHQTSSASHIDRYSTKGQKVKDDEIAQKDEEKGAGES